MTEEVRRELERIGLDETNINNYVKNAKLSKAIVEVIQEV
jgi:hypothetical protein